MSKIEDHRFNKSNYDRPTQKYVCGRSASGAACQMGPGSDGECQSQFECIPNKKGDRWFCSRSQTNGGRCSRGPSPLGICACSIPKCIPFQNARQQRKKIVRWAVISSFTFILLFFYFPTKPEIVTPGELNKEHQFLDEKCNVCHKSASFDPFEWVQKVSLTWSKNAANGVCEKCHQFGQYGGEAHTGAPGLLSDDESMSRPDDISCVFCHREHRGRRANLAQVSDQLCQGCHKKMIASFDADHVEFENYPFKRRTRLIYDHNTHLNDYFLRDAKQGWLTTDCSRCHMPGNDGHAQRVETFDKICKDCHVDEVTAKRLEVKHISIFQIPALDTETLNNAGLGVGRWPSALEDEEISPALILLLSSNIELTSILTQLSKSEIDLADLSEQPKSIIAQVNLLAWSIKALFYKIDRYGDAWFYDNLTRLYSGEQALLDARHFSKNIPYSVIGIARRQWFPRMIKEIKTKKYKKYAYLFTETNFEVQTRKNENAVSDNNWVANDFNVSYQPKGHGDVTMKNMLDLVMHSSNKPFAKSLFFSQLTYKKAPGQCTKCHSVDMVGQRKLINWYPELTNQTLSTRSAVTALTGFSHASHSNVRMSDGCVDCHVLDKKSKYLESYRGFDFTKNISNFVDTPKSTCSACHQGSKSGENCALCHQYHLTKSNTE